MTGPRPLRIAFVLTTFPLPGAGFIYDRITGLIDRGHHVRIFALAPPATSFPPHEHLAGYRLEEITSYHGMPRSPWRRVASLLGDLAGDPAGAGRDLQRSLDRRIFAGRRWNLAAYRAVRAFVPQAPFDVVHCFAGPSAANVLFLKDLFPRAVFIASFMGFDFSSRLRKAGVGVYRDLFRRGDLMLTLSGYSRDCLVGLGCPPEKIVRHPLGIDPGRIGFRRREVAADEALQLITVARLVEKKGHRVALEAVGAALAGGHRVTYHLVGSGPLEGAIRRQVEADPLLRGNVVLHGYRPQGEVRCLLEKAHVFLHPSVTALRGGEQEDTPTAILEAQAGGLPVIATYHAGIPEIVRDRQTGILVPERDAGAIEQAILEYLGNRPRIGADGERGRRFVERRYDVRRQNANLERLLLAMAGRAGSAPPVHDTDELDSAAAGEGAP